jgi:CheY-like chemotaxis protein
VTAPAAQTPQPAVPRGEPVNILIVDDRPENLLAVEAILEPLGQTLVRALADAEALRHLLEREFACILLDVQMPGMNGFEVARVIKSREPAFTSARSSTPCCRIWLISSSSVISSWRMFRRSILPSRTSGSGGG